MRVQVLGLCRFSLLSTNSFQTTGFDLTENRRILYDPARMDLRMRWFENLCLPPLLWQSDPDFTLILATGEDLPQPWLGRLQDLAAAVPQIRLEQVAPGPHGKVCSELLAKHTEPGADIVAQFRIDDDDTVASDYVDTVRRDYHRFGPGLGRDAVFAVDYARGLTLTQQGDQHELRCELARLWGCGLTMYFPNDRPRSIMNYRHDWLWRLADVISIQNRIMWVRGVHGTNDSPRDKYRPVLVDMPQDRIDAALGKRFGLDRRLLTDLLAGKGPCPE